jgi:ABC-type polysaccharide/polyol phosphate transport system ATPase subunit
MIIVKDLSKYYQMQNFKQVSALSLVVRMLTKNDPAPKRLALRDISFTINSNETVGVIGLNGSGKSTLLKIIAGIYVPSSGTVKAKGRCIYLNGFGHGLKERLTMHENIYLVGALMGVPTNVIDRLYGKIVEFSELQDFVDQQVFTFSSGMRSRLSFSISIHFLEHKRPDIIILDEVLSAGGDLNFTAKASAKMTEFIKQGSTVMIASHNMDDIKRFCSKVLWIKEGTLHACGETDEIIQQYTLGR